jgi:hypothetical protein
MKLLIALAILGAFVANGSVALADIPPFDPNKRPPKPVEPAPQPEPKKEEKAKEKAKDKEKPKKEEKKK